MKKILIIAGIIVLACVFMVIDNKKHHVKNSEIFNIKEDYCLTGAFVSDRPDRKDILDFKKNYGKKPYFVMMFVEWEQYPDLGSIKAILDEQSCPFITWEPWAAVSKKGIDFDALLQGDYDEYIKDFARLIKSFKSEIFLRFAHEMNGNWYPWTGSKIGSKKYKEIYRYVKDVFYEMGIDNVQWVFSVNWENIPAMKANEIINYWPGDSYVDYVGIDGYNWGDTQSWSSWIEFKVLFNNAYYKITEDLKKPIIISEFGSASSPGDKASWVKNAFKNMKELKNIKGFVLFNVDKETDWRFDPGSKSAEQLKVELKDTYFVG